MVQTFVPDFLIEDLSDEPQRSMYRYWLKHSETRSFPTKSALDPVEFPRMALPVLAVLEPTNTDDFKIRVIGTKVQTSVGFDYTGHTMSELPGSTGAIDRLRHCRDKGEPYFAGGPATGPLWRRKFYTVLVLPFGNDNLVQRLMLVFHFTHHTPEILHEVPEGVAVPSD